MPLEIAQGDIFQADVSSIVCPVNVVSVMGNGLAKIVSLRSKTVFDEYRRQYSARGYPDAIDPKNQLIHKLIAVPFTEWNPKQQIILFPTKKHWLRPSRLEWIDTNLELLARDYRKLNIKSLGVPAIGCGKGELQWRDVLPLIEKHLTPLPIRVVVFEPNSW